MNAKNKAVTIEEKKKDSCLVVCLHIATRVSNDLTLDTQNLSSQSVGSFHVKAFCACPAALCRCRGFAAAQAQSFTLRFGTEGKVACHAVSQGMSVSSSPLPLGPDVTRCRVGRTVACSLSSSSSSTLTWTLSSIFFSVKEPLRRSAV